MPLQRSEHEAHAPFVPRRPVVAGTASSNAAMTSASSSLCPRQSAKVALDGTPSQQIIVAQRIGARVPPSPLLRGRVHSVYRRACNIETRDGVLLTLISHEVGNLPHGIRCILPEPADLRVRLRPAQAVVPDNAFLHIPAAGLKVDLSGAVPWHCELTACAINTRSEHTLAVLSDIRALLRDRECSGGLAPLLLRDTQPRDPLDRAMRGRLLAVLPVLERAMANLDCALAAQALGRLIGLGPGLTPSGDDFIVGYLAALHASGVSEPQIGHLARELGGPVTRLADGTNAISRQYLLNASMGEVSEPLAQVLWAISRQDRTTMLTAVDRVVGIGHSSGADCLVGLLFGLSPALLLAHARHAGIRLSADDGHGSGLPRH